MGQREDKCDWSVVASGWQRRLLEHEEDEGAVRTSEDSFSFPVL